MRRTLKGIKGICNKCGKRKELTKHSLVGNHRPPFILLCRKCHDEEHSMRPKSKYPGKYQPGTLKSKRKKR